MLTRLHYLPGWATVFLERDTMYFNGFFGRSFMLQRCT